MISKENNFNFFMKIFNKHITFYAIISVKINFVKINL
jgi:hypothetical protein